MTGRSLLLAAWRLNRTVPLLIAALLLLNMAAYAVLAYLEAPRIDTLERRYIERQALVREARQAGAAIATPQRTFLRGRQDLEVFREAIPPRSAFTDLIGEVFSLASEAGLAIDRIGYDPEEDTGRNLLRYGLQFTVTGRYGELKRFVYALEQSERLIAIEELTLRSGEAQGGEVALAVRLSTYFTTDRP